LNISLSKQDKISYSLGKTTNSRAAAKEQAAGTQKAKGDGLPLIVMRLGVSILILSPHPLNSVTRFGRTHQVKLN